MLRVSLTNSNHKLRGICPSEDVDDRDELVAELRDDLVEHRGPRIDLPTRLRIVDDLAVQARVHASGCPPDREQPVDHLLLRPMGCLVREAHGGSLYTRGPKIGG
jgi:hypothetical protein